MHDVALRRRIAALVTAALLSLAGACVLSATIADDAQAAATQGQYGDAVADAAQALRVNDGDAMDARALRSLAVCLVNGGDEEICSL